MYTPDAFRVAEPAKLTAFMQAHSFATVITHDGTSSFASHLPVLWRPEPGEPLRGTLSTHLARANPQVRHFEEGREVLVIFQGPHAYVSPAWYATAPAVPTWNFTAVHAYGVPRVIAEHDRLVALLREMVAWYDPPEAGRWNGELPDDFRDRMIGGLVGLEIAVTRIEGKYKLSQNRSVADRLGVWRALAASADPGDRALAECMRAEGLAG